MYKLLSLLALLLMNCSSTPKQVVLNHKIVTIDTVQTVFDTIRMGRVNEGEVLSGAFAIANKSEKPAVIANVVTGCGCTTVDYDTKPIKPNEERVINFLFDTRGRRGWQLKSIEVVTTDYMKATIFIEAEILINNNK